MSDSGTRGPTWKLISFLRRRRGLTAEEFVTYWRDIHAPLLQQRTDFWRHVRRYVQNYALVGRDSPIGLPDSHDGVSELWFDTLPELKAAFREPGFEAVRTDARRFVDLDGSVSWIAEVIHLKDAGPTNIKLFGAGHARAGLTREGAQAYWRDEHPEVLARDAPECWRMIKRYDQDHTRSPGDLSLDTITDSYDFCAEVGTDSAQAMQELFTREDYMAIVRPDELRFAAVDDSIACATRESVLYDSAAG